MNSVLTPLFDYLATVGPGEAFAGLDAPEDGRRRHRVPRPPKFFPYRTTARLLVGIAGINEVFDVNDVDGADETVPGGLPPRMLELTDLALYGT